MTWDDPKMGWLVAAIWIFLGLLFGVFLGAYLTFNVNGWFALGTALWTLGCMAGLGGVLTKVVGHQ